MFAQAFDDLLLLKSGGHVVYHGSLGKRSHRLIQYFEAIPGVPRLQEGLNPGACAAFLFCADQCLPSAAMLPPVVDLAHTAAALCGSTAC